MHADLPLADRSHCPPAPGDGARDGVTALMLAVAAAMGRVPLPGTPPLSPESIARYVGDATETAFNGSDEQRVELIARLLLLTRATARPHHPAPAPSLWLGRLERTLRSWERDRRRGTASPRPRPEDVERRMAMFNLTEGPNPLIDAPTVALALAELVAVHLLAGSISLEDGMRSVDAVRPLVREAALKLEQPDADLPPGVYERPGATLAHVDHVAWQIDQILRQPSRHEELRWLRALWLELAAALVYAQDAHDGTADHTARWRAVGELAVEKMTVGCLRRSPATYDVRRALGLVRAAALPFAGLWLDELHAPEDPPLAAMLEDRVLLATAQALLGAWVAQHQLTMLGGEQEA